MRRPAQHPVNDGGVLCGSSFGWIARRLFVLRAPCCFCPFSWLSRFGARGGLFFCAFRLNGFAGWAVQLPPALCALCLAAIAGMPCPTRGILLRRHGFIQAGSPLSSANRSAPAALMTSVLRGKAEAGTPMAGGPSAPVPSSSHPSCAAVGRCSARMCSSKKGAGSAIESARFSRPL